MSSFAIYIVGYIIFLAGLAYGASLLGIDRQWIVVGLIVLIGIGIFTGATSTRRRDPPQS
jgi:hypothetical protein